MSGFTGRIGRLLLQLGLALYLIIALIVGNQIQREQGTPAYGTVATIIEGAAWPITLLVDAVQRQ